MTVRTRLLVFTATLVMVFGLAWGLGAVLGLPEGPGSGGGTAPSTPGTSTAPTASVHHVEASP